MVFYCECAAEFCNDLGNQDDGYLSSLVRTFGQALKLIDQLPALDRNALIARLDRGSCCRWQRHGPRAARSGDQLKRGDGSGFYFSDNRVYDRCRRWIPGRVDGLPSNRRKGTAIRKF
jgi:hypothetical protein